MGKWQIILLAAGLSYVLRALPIVMFSKLTMHSDGLLYKYLNYAALSVMGGIIYSALFGSLDRQHFEAQLLESQNLLKLATVILAFVLTAWKRRVFVTLLCCLLFYYCVNRLIEA